MKKGLFITALLMAAGSVFAQDGGSSAPGQVKLLEMVKTGGWAMWPLGAFSFFMVILVIQNFISLRTKTLLHSEQMPELLEMMLAKKSKTALIYCRKNPSMFANTFGAGLERCLDGEAKINFQKVQESVEEASVEQMTKLMKPIDYLSVIGATAPMLGLLGTVSGMIKAFNTLGTSGTEKSSELASNIGEALITTATGLVIAIPAMFFFFMFKKGFQKTLATLGRNIGFLFDALETGKMPMSFTDLETLEKMDGD